MINTRELIRTRSLALFVPLFLLLAATGATWQVQDNQEAALNRANVAVDVAVERLLHEIDLHFQDLERGLDRLATRSHEALTMLHATADPGELRRSLAADIEIMAFTTERLGTLLQSLFRELIFEIRCSEERLLLDLCLDAEDPVPDEVLRPVLERSLSRLQDHDPEIGTLLVKTARASGLQASAAISGGLLLESLLRRLPTRLLPRGGLPGLLFGLALGLAVEIGLREVHDPQEELDSEARSRLQALRDGLVDGDSQVHEDEKALRDFLATDPPADLRDQASEILELIGGSGRLGLRRDLETAVVSLRSRRSAVITQKEPCHDQD